MMQNGPVGIFLAFRTFNGNARNLLLNIQERITSKNIHFQYYLKCSAETPKRRAFCHVEMVLDDWCWFGTFKGEKVFVRKKKKSAIMNYKQFALMMVPRKVACELFEFARVHQSEPFSLPIIAWNWTLHHVLGWSGGLVRSKRLWYCSKLVIESMLHAGIVGNGELDPLTSTPEDIYWWCVEKVAGDATGGRSIKYFMWDLPEFLLYTDKKCI